jgi:D-lactate dehydrogenase (cytochrome)
MDTPVLKNSTVQAIAELRALLGDRLSTALIVREQHGKDQTWNPAAAPDAVAYVQSTLEVQAAVKICSRHAVPIIPFGAGS